MHMSDSLSFKAFVEKRLGISLDPRQRELLGTNPGRVVLNCTRQWGKSTMAAAKAVYRSVESPGSLVVVTSPSGRQTAELVRKMEGMYASLKLSFQGDGDNEISVILENTSRIVGMPGNERTIRGFSAVSLLLVDEASRVDEDYFDAIMPMLAVSDGDVWLMSTPFFKTGYFYDSWTGGDPEWTRVKVTAPECPRISGKFLERERRRMSPARFRREYMAEFEDAEDAIFSLDKLRRQIDPKAEGLDL